MTNKTALGQQLLFTVGLSLASSLAKDLLINRLIEHDASASTELDEKFYRSTVEMASGAAALGVGLGRKSRVRYRKKAGRVLEPNFLEGLRELCDINTWLVVAALVLTQMAYCKLVRPVLPELAGKFAAKVKI